MCSNIYYALVNSQLNYGITLWLYFKALIPLFCSEEVYTQLV